MTSGSIDQDKIIAQVFADLAKSALKTTATALLNPIGKLIDAYNKDLQTYLKSTLTRCSQIKTLLHREEPVPLSSIYITTHFKCAEKKYDDHSLLEALPKLKSIVLVGSAGSGKSMFTKYLFTSLFEKSGGKIPLYIELRQMNAFHTKDLIAFMYHSIVAPGGVVTKEQFESGLKNGLFSIILDGFDEIDFDWREDLEKQILFLREKYPQIIVIVSSRFDERFTAWTSFYVFKVEPMSKDQVVSLIKKLNYDEDIKSKFIKTVEGGLYKKHSSFLSNPLLAIMMLITFDQFAHIPDKIHIFYEYAFDALFFRHDASKHGGYRRKLRTEMPIDDFKNCLSSFCISTYAKEKLQFTESEFRDHLKKALDFESKSVDIDNFATDLLEAVCVFQKDGLFLTFTHRSFQEYFAAFFISRSPSISIRNLLDQISRRALTDDVLTMAFDMNPGLIEREWVLPNLILIGNAASKIDRKKDLIAHLRIFWGSTFLVLDTYGIAVRDATDIGHARAGIMKVYDSMWAPIRKEHGERQPSNVKAFKKTVDDLKRQDASRFEITAKKGDEKKPSFEIELHPSDTKWLRRTWLHSFIEAEMKALKLIRVNIERTLSSKEKMVADLFS